MGRGERSWAIPAFLGGALLAGVAGVFLAWWIPHRKMGDAGWIEEASPEEQRRTAHAALALPWGRHHDAFVILARHGDAGSVPYLIRGLRRMGDLEPGGGMTCSRAHCVEALERITGYRAGWNHRDWARWREETRGAPLGKAIPAR